MIQVLNNGITAKAVYFNSQMVWPKYSGIRYIRWWQWQNIATADAGTYFGELKANAISGRVMYNIASGSIVTSDFVPIYGGNLSNITDGDINTYSGTNIGPFPHWVEVDLGVIIPGLANIEIWGYHISPYLYERVMVEVSHDRNSWFKVFDTQDSGTYTETSSGKIIDMSHLYL